MRSPPSSKIGSPTRAARSLPTAAHRRTRWRTHSRAPGGGERHRDQFEEIADLHRGETVLVVGHQTALGIVVPSLARNITPAWTRDRDLGNAESVELDRDADGWLLRRWGSLTID